MVVRVVVRGSGSGRVSAVVVVVVRVVPVRVAGGVAVVVCGVVAVARGVRSWLVQRRLPSCDHDARI